MDNDEDDDGNFAKWMSSYWGHSASEEPGKERKRSFQRQSRSQRDRRASLPCAAQLDTLQLNYFQSVTMAPGPVPLKLRDDMESKANPRDRRVSSGGAANNPPADNRTIVTIPELSETFEKKLRFRSRNVMSLSDADDMCLICHDEMRGDGGAVRELHCSHRFHRECIERWLWKEQSCPTCSIHVAMPEPLYWSSTHLKVP